MGLAVVHCRAFLFFFRILSCLLFYCCALLTLKSPLWVVSVRSSLFTFIVIVFCFFFFVFFFVVVFFFFFFFSFFFFFFFFLVKSLFLIVM